MRRAAPSPPNSSTRVPTWRSGSPRPGPKAIEYIKANPKEARKHLAKNTMTPDDLVDVVPMLGYIMTKDMNAKQKDELQRFADFGVQIGVVPEKIELSKSRQGVLLRVDMSAMAALCDPHPTAACAAAVKDDPSSRRPHVTIRGLSKQFDKAVIYDKFDLDIPRGKLISVFGPNGCGKSTLINMIAGLIPVDAGQILFDGMLLQRDQVRLRLPELPRSPVSLAARLRQHRLSAQDDEHRQGGRSAARAWRSWSRISVSGFDLNRYPYEMSGGQQQLVSIMRALIVEPEILFLDEPFSALDYEMTLFMREQLQRIFVETGTTTVLVSHDLEEAVYLADYVLLLSRHPAQVADFVAVRRGAPAGPTPRCRELDFVRVKAHCLEVFQREVRKSWEAAFQPFIPAGSSAPGSA